MQLFNKPALKTGFTLIEISIALVIIGLIIGGILTGSDLIRAARARTIITEETQYITAAMTFRTKYNSMPGDFSNAVGMLAAANGGNSSDNYTTSCYTQNASPGTCNGNGDGYIGLSPYDPLQGYQGWRVINGTSGTEDEGVLFWNHLALAGLISGTYQPVFWPAAANLPMQQYGKGPMVYPGYNIPVSKAYDIAGWSLWNIYIPAQDGFLGFSGNNTSGQMLFYGAQTTSIYWNYQDANLYPVLTALQSQAIDKKIDDGSPMTGKVQTALQGDSAYAPNCTTTNNPATSQYAVSTASIVCSLYFMVF